MPLTRSMSKSPRKCKLGTAAVRLRTALGLMKESTKNNELLPKRITGTLQLDYFGNAADQAEGLQILETSTAILAVFSEVLRL